MKFTLLGRDFPTDEVASIARFMSETPAGAVLAEILSAVVEEGRSVLETDLDENNTNRARGALVAAREIHALLTRGIPLWYKNNVNAAAEPAASHQE